MTTIHQHHLPARLSPALTVWEAITNAVTRFLVALGTPNKPLFEPAFTKSTTLSVDGNVFEACGKKAGVTASTLSQQYRTVGVCLQGSGKDALVMGSLYWVELVITVAAFNTIFNTIKTFVPVWTPSSQAPSPLSSTQSPGHLLENTMTAIGAGAYLVGILTEAISELQRIALKKDPAK
ncbi:hypothetical protein BJX62DRAFT_245383 [Aspergillus germanicus]